MSYRLNDAVPVAARQRLSLRHLDIAHHVTRYSPAPRPTRRRVHDRERKRRVGRADRVARAVFDTPRARSGSASDGSPGEYVRQRRLDPARGQLAQSDRSIAEIALDAGFSSPSHFATAFRRAMGMSPRDYRMLRS